MDTAPDDTHPEVEVPARARTAAPDAADVDVWWGGYWGWALLPSWLVCLAVAGVLGVSTWILFRNTGYGQVVTLTASGGILLVQLLRWAMRFFGRTYRLTNRRLFVERGIFRPAFLLVDLVQLTRVEVRADWLDRLVRVGHIELHFENERLAPVVLEGVHDAEHAARLIRETLQRARGTAKA
jgi:hypothetical protein